MTPKTIGSAHTGDTTKLEIVSYGKQGLYHFESYYVTQLESAVLSE